MALIQLDDVTKAFFSNRRKDEVQVALNHVSLAVEQGEFVSLLGPSGCGKTVTLNLLAGFDQPTTGRVLCCGNPITKPDPSRGVVFQEFSLFPWLSVEENVLYALNGQQLSAAEKKERTAAALRAVGLAGHEQKRPNLLSGGMKQRAAIARLLAMDSEVFLMDEPFSALDEQIREALDKTIFDIWREKRKTIVFVTHSIAEAVSISSRIVLFSNSPGTILREWSVPADMPRDFDSPEARELRDEIKSLFPVSGI